MWSDSASVSMVMWTHKGDLNLALWENSKKSSSSTILHEKCLNTDLLKEIQTRNNSTFGHFSHSAKSTEASFNGTVIKKLLM